jgi:hypothetical protein
VAQAQEKQGDAMKTVRNILLVIAMLAFVAFRPAAVKADGCLHSCVLACESDESWCNQSACNYKNACINNCNGDPDCINGCYDDYDYQVGQCAQDEADCETACGC